MKLHLYQGDYFSSKCRILLLFQQISAFSVESGDLVYAFLLWLLLICLHGNWKWPSKIQLQHSVLHSGICRRQSRGRAIKAAWGKTGVSMTTAHASDRFVWDTGFYISALSAAISCREGWKKNCHKHEKSHEPASSLIYYFHMVYLEGSLATILWENTEPREKV